MVGCDGTLGITVWWLGIFHSSSSLDSSSYECRISDSGFLKRQTARCFVFRDASLLIAVRQGFNLLKWTATRFLPPSVFLETVYRIGQCLYLSCKNLVEVWTVFLRSPSGRMVGIAIPDHQLCKVLWLPCFHSNTYTLVESCPNFYWPAHDHVVVSLSFSFVKGLQKQQKHTPTQIQL